MAIAEVARAENSPGRVGEDEVVALLALAAAGERLDEQVGRWAVRMSGMDAFWTSAGLVALGAAVSLATTLIVEFVKSKRERERDEAAAQRTLAAAAAQLERERIDRGREHAKEVFDDFNELWNHTVIARDWENAGAEANELRTRVYSNYLLIADPITRAAVSDGLYALGNYRRVVLEPDPNETSAWSAVLFRIRSIVAAHLRGENPNGEEIRFLAAIRDDLDLELGH